MRSAPSSGEREAMRLTPEELKTLTVLHGGATEYQEIQARLFAAGRRWCPACRSVLTTMGFYANARMNLGLSSYCRTCTKERRARDYVKLSNPTRLARFYRRHPSKRPAPSRGRYTKTLEARAAGRYIVDPIHDDLWLAGEP